MPVQTYATHGSTLFQPKNPKPEYISVQSFDFDGCIFHHGYHNPEDLITKNEKLWDYIKRHTRRARNIICMVGSNRQSKLGDLSNAFTTKTTSCFVSMRKVHKHLTPLLDPKPCDNDEFLLSDLYCGRKSGYNFKKSVEDFEDENSCRRTTDDFIFDDSKVSILYPQIHKTASENPGKPIEFTFYDDRKDILFGLKKFYKNNRNLIPLGTTLKLRIYHGDGVYSICNIEGTGIIDYHYRESVQEMARLVTEKTQLMNGDEIREDIAGTAWNFKEKLQQNDHLDKFRKYRDQLNGISSEQKIKAAH